MNNDDDRVYYLQRNIDMNILLKNKNKIINKQNEIIDAIIEILDYCKQDDYRPDFRSVLCDYSDKLIKKIIEYRERQKDE